MAKGWRVNKEQELAIQCSLIKSPVVFIEPIPKHKIELLMGKYPHQEWIGYLVGRVSDKENYFVEEISIPPHKEVSGASAEAEPLHIPKGCIGVIHSHHSMGAFHSGTDQDYVDKNFPISITVAKSGQGMEFDAVSYQTTACGKGITIKGQVKYVQPKPVFNTEEFMMEATKNIDKGKRVSVQIYYPAVTTVPPYIHGTLPHTNLPYSGYRDYIVGENGERVTQEELDEHLRDIWGD